MMMPETMGGLLSLLLAGLKIAGQAFASVEPQKRALT